jgi:hypothetical protein
MAVVTDYLFHLISKQVADSQLVVWYDPERVYADAVGSLSIPKTTIARYDGSFVKLRREIDSLLNGEQPPRLVVYVPEERTKTHHALIELEAAGIIMQPGQQPPNRNTRLAIVARNALKAVLGDENAAEAEKQAEAGKLTLADLNSLADKGKDLSTGVLTLVYGTANPQEVGLAFLGSDRLDAAIEKKAAINELIGLLQTAFDIELADDTKFVLIRERLARHVLMTDLVTGVGESIPGALGSVKVAQTPVGVDHCIRLARSWRNNREARDSYVAAAHRVELEMALDKLDFNPVKLVEIDTFLSLERVLLRHVEKSLLDDASPELLKLSESRLARFWAEVTPTIQARWALVASAAEVLLEADRVAKALKKTSTTIPALVKAYADDEEPWCLLDTHHRHMETRWYNFDPNFGNEHDSLEKLIIKAEQRYTDVGSELAKQFVTQIGKAKHPIKGLMRQRDIFETQVKPKLGESKVAYVWVDALRYEMARELGRLLKDDFEVTIQPALGTPPTITEIGMAALLPKAHASAKVVSVGGGKLALEIDGTVIRDRKERVTFLKEHAGVSVFEAKLDDLLPKPSKKIAEGIQGAQLVLITSQEIDELGEQNNSSQARLQVDGVLGHLRRGVRVLANHGVKTIILVADHGHWFADKISEDMKIEAPGGKAEDLHPRVWVGIGGTSASSFLRMPLNQLGVDSDLDLATPWNFACFKSKGGGNAYFHGGLSPQELIIPVMTLVGSVQAASTFSGINWTLLPGSTKLTTRFFSIQISGQQSGLFGSELPKVRIEVRANKKCVSVPVSASYGYEDSTGEIAVKFSEHDAKKLESNTVTVMIAEDITQKTVSVVLLDASTGNELAKIDAIEVAISM